MNDTSLSGSVLFDDGAPAPGVRVSDGATTTTTDAAGRFQIVQAATDAGRGGRGRQAFVAISRPAGTMAGTWWRRVDPQDPEPVVFTLTHVEQTLPFEIVQLSDVHVTTPERVEAGAYAASLYPEGSFEQELADLLTRIAVVEPGAQSVVVTGDLTDFGMPDEFEALKRALALSPLPVSVIPGNHDHMSGRHTSVVTASGYLTNDGDPAHYEDALGPRWYSFDVPGLHVVSIDWHTHELGLDAAEQEEWLRGDLAHLDVGAPWLLLSHDQPSGSILDALPWAPVGILSGHWHTDRVVRRDSTLHVNTAPALFGGLDAGPSMYRVVEWDGGRLSARSSRAVSVQAPAPAETAGLRIPVARGELAPGAASTGDLIIVATADSDSATGAVCAFSPDSGREVWSTATPEPVKAKPVIGEAHVVARQVGGTVTVLDAASGEIAWSRQVGDAHRTFAWAAPAVAGGVMVVGEPQDLRALDVATGEELWRRTGLAPHHNLVNHASPVIAGGLVVVGVWPVPARPLAFDLRTGESRWAPSDGPDDYFGAGGPMSIGTAAFDADSDAIVIPGHGRTTMVDRATGDVVWSVTHPGGSSPATPLPASAGVVVGVAGQGYRLLDRVDGATIWSIARSSPEDVVRHPYGKRPRWTPAGAVALRDATLLAGSDGLLQIVDAQGRVVNQVDLGEPVLGVPRVDGDRVAVTTPDAIRVLDLGTEAAR